MTSPYSRVSGVWGDYFHEDGEEEAQEEPEIDRRTRLDKTIDKIGMGSYQWTLLALCGFGWMADNCWIQTTAIILPRVQQHFDVPDSYIGALSFSLFFGMMLGAVGWGACSDLMGRIAAFNATLFFTALFGVLAGFSPNFPSLCFSMFFLGSAVGGSMPTDGTLLLEHMPNGKQYLLTALSVFFSFGSVISAIVGILVLPRYSCLNTSSEPCSPEQNMGWKYMLFILGILTMLMFVARVIFFRLYESPRFLVHAGRPQDAVESLQRISEFNGGEIAINVRDVDDRRFSLSLTSREASHTTDFRLSRASLDTTNYHSTTISSTTPAALVSSPIEDRRLDSVEHGETEGLVSNEENKPHRSARRIPRRVGSSSSHQSKSTEIKWEALAKLPIWIAKPLAGWLDRLSTVLSPEWRTTTLLVWCIWFALSLAFTMFNVFLPKLLEGRSVSSEHKSLEETMWDVVIFTLGGCPGALLGAYLIQSGLGRRLSLASSTLVTAMFCMLFVFVEGRWATRATTVGISLAATTMWAVLYGMTPEIFPTKVRGTACGNASALSRIGGMVAPLAGGSLLMISPSMPVYTSVVVFTIGGLCTLLLKVDETHRKGSGGASIVH
ncbi:hypothetical protein M422DRAFT_25278 [Sphaerobolus stellatus SS14]|nr:hypothetical protein M422DRAFT_25278 [Sphaerobolus stellatus SS14]